MLIFALWDLYQFMNQAHKSLVDKLAKFGFGVH